MLKKREVILHSGACAGSSPLTYPGDPATEHDLFVGKNLGLSAACNSVGKLAIEDLKARFFSDLQLDRPDSNLYLRHDKTKVPHNGTDCP